MTIQPINTDKAPAAIGPYSQAISTDDKLYTSGQLPLDPVTGKIVEGPIDQQAHQVFKNLKAIAEAAGTSLDKTVKTTVFLDDIADFQAVNEVYKEYFSQPFPARSAYQVAALPLGARVEVEAVIAI
ncbi:MAG: RidA family protein [Desulfocapsaceae bacterium]|nr:RidA family protein [Desulfocapsaceae bacterium]